VNTECPSETKSLDNSIECNADDCAAGTASSENDAVGETTSAKEVLRRSNSDRLVILSAL
jgi:hypothetical protein